MTRRTTAPRLATLAAGMLLVLTVAACGGGGGGTAASSRPAPAEARLPDVTLRAFQGGGSLDLGSLEGPAVVNLWASWCVPCRRELPFYEQLARRQAGKVDVIGIDFRETRLDKAKQLVRDTGVTYPLYADPDGAVRAIGLPKILLIAADGTVAHEEYVEIADLGQLEDLVRRYLPGVIA